MLRIVVFLTSLFILFHLDAQKVDDFHGSWTGIITQEDGATIRYFDMEMSLIPDKDSTQIFNISSHVKDGEYHAYMLGTGKLNNKSQLFVVEHEIVRYDSIPGMEWCLKRYTLDLSMDKGDLHMKGEWSGGTSFGLCQPGKLNLVRKVIRP